MAQDKRNARVLIVEDSETLAFVYRQYLETDNFDVCHAPTLSAARVLIDEFLPDVALVDLRLPDGDGMDLIRHIQEAALPIGVVVMTAHGSVTLAVEAMSLGAGDFLEKPFNAERLRITLNNLFEQQRLHALVDSYRELYEAHRFEGFVGSSFVMQAVYRTIETVGPSQASVFITGESGTGKEVCAAALHARSERKNAPFIALNCAALPRDLVESELFGHVKGAFTGAYQNHTGAVTRADGGTLFLDEITEMPIELQAKLLRFVQTRQFTPLGGSRSQGVDIRLVCATNRDPLVETKEGRLREDLYYRLHVVPIALPPLRERGDDILQLAEHFLKSSAKEEGKRFDGFATDARELLLSYAWPGNVRQLQNVIRSTTVLNEGPWIGAEMLPESLKMADRALQDGALIDPDSLVVDPPPTSDPSISGYRHTQPCDIRPLHLVERDAIESAITFCEGNVVRAASLLEISPSTIYRKRQSWQ